MFHRNLVCQRNVKRRTCAEFYDRASEASFSGIRLSFTAFDSSQHEVCSTPSTFSAKIRQKSSFTLSSIASHHIVYLWYKPVGYGSHGCFKSAGGKGTSKRFIRRLFYSKLCLSSSSISISMNVGDIIPGLPLKRVSLWPFSIKAPTACHLKQGSFENVAPA